MTRSHKQLKRAAGRQLNIVITADRRDPIDVARIVRALLTAADQRARAQGAQPTTEGRDD